MMLSYFLVKMMGSDIKAKVVDALRYELAEKRKGSSLS
jgi:hypothetical protein